MRGHIRKRGNTYSVVVDIGRGEDGKRKQKWHSGFTTRREAQKALTEIMTRLDAQTYVAPSKQTVAVYLNEWLGATRSSVRVSTWESYKATLENHVMPTLGSTLLQNLTAASLNTLYASLLEDGRRDDKGGLSPRTVRYTHTIIRRALSDALRWNRLTRNVADQANPPRRASSAEMKTWTADEVRTFLSSTQDDRLHGAWRMAVTTGMRRGEVLGLRWRDVDLDASRVSIQQTLVSVGYEVGFSEPKTAKGKRSVALDAGTVTALRDHRKRQASERLAWGPAYQDQDLVFCREDGSPIHPDWFSKAFGRREKKAGLPIIRLHDLRHTHASLALAAGVHPKVVSERLGHANISITLDTYSHAIPALQEEAAEMVAALVGG